MEILFWISFAMAGIYLIAKATKTKKPTGLSVPLTGRLPPTGDCGLHAVGESHYQSHLRATMKSLGRGKDKPLTAYIVTEPDNPHDKNACAVYINGGKVGHLNRDDARHYVAQMRKNNIPNVSRFEANAKIIGGTDGKQNIGVMLDLPLE